MRIKFIVVFAIIIAILWLIIQDAIRTNEAKKLVSKLSPTTASDTTQLITPSNVAEINRYYLTNGTGIIPSGQAWVRISPTEDNVLGRIDTGNGYQELDGYSSNLSPFYVDFAAKGKVSPQIRIDATGTKMLIEYQR